MTICPFRKSAVFRVLALPVALLTTAIRVNAGLAYFDSISDTINVTGGTNIGSAITIEAIIYLNVAPVGPTNIFNEYSSGLEDKALGFDGAKLSGYAFPAGGSGLQQTVSLSLNNWHHVAFVFSGIQDRLYLDGALVAARNTISSVSNASGFPFIGANPRSDTTSPNGYDSSFQGYIDTLRVSASERYTGASFAAPTGDLASDASTQLLYNFNEAPGSTTVIDLSGNGHTGTLGTGFVGSTSPDFVATVPEPTAFALLCVAVPLLASRRRKIR